uniref:Secreted protein n=1 Tax=Rhipicephalus appendiculatus TaxID=34631 RepID=A0A131YFD2_RHIAP
MRNLFSLVLLFVATFFCILCGMQQLAFAGGGCSKCFQRPLGHQQRTGLSRHHSPRREHFPLHHRLHHSPLRQPHFHLQAPPRQAPLHRARLLGTSQDPRVKHNENAKL